VTPTDRPVVLFVCVHNAGRSQMAAAFLEQIAGDRIGVLSAGTEPANAINPVVMTAMAEKGIDLHSAHPKLLTDQVASEADVVITMGCGDACPVYPGRRREDWELDDPAGQDLQTVRRIRDDIEARVHHLVDELIASDKQGA
jgi:arsenate reductase (thioredoxin)